MNNKELPENAKAFVKELQTLLDKYNAYLQADDYYGGYAECGQDIKIIATFPDFTEIDFGNYIDETSKVKELE